MLTHSFATIIIGALLGVTVQAAVIESVNATSSPTPGLSWAAADVGWLYTPSLGYWLTGVETKFGTADARTITVEIYSDAPPQGGTLLRSADFTASTTFAGASFQPLLITAGQQFFIGFRNLAGLGANTTTANQGMQSLGSNYHDFDGSGSYAVHVPWTTGDTDRPILLLNGTTVPEPGTCAFVVVALTCFAARRRTTYFRES